MRSLRQDYVCDRRSDRLRADFVRARSAFRFIGERRIRLQQAGQSFHRQPDHVGKAAADDRDERIPVLNAVAA